MKCSSTECSVQQRIGGCTIVQICFKSLRTLWSCFSLHLYTMQIACITKVVSTKVIFVLIPAVVSVNQMDRSKPNILLLETLYHVLDTKAVGEELYLQRRSRNTRVQHLQTHHELYWQCNSTFCCALVISERMPE